MSLDQWIEDFNAVSDRALMQEWFVSPLEYSWGAGKSRLDKIFCAARQPDPIFDQLMTPEIFRHAMNAPFRAEMMVYAVMRQPVAKSFGVEIESGLLSFYRLDFLACLSQWIYVIEGYCRKLFSARSTKRAASQQWILPTTANELPNRLIASLAKKLGTYLDKIVFKSVLDPHIEQLNRNLLLHGNVANKSFFSQKNCLIVLFVLDALLMIELVSNGEYPLCFEPAAGDTERIAQRQMLYVAQISAVFEKANLLKIDLLKQHLETSRETPRQ